MHAPNDTDDEHGQLLRSLAKGHNPEPRIHPHASVAVGAKIGAGTLICEGVRIGVGADIGERCYVGEKTFVGDGVTLGRSAKLCRSVSVTGGVTIGDRVIVASGAAFVGDDPENSKAGSFHPDPSTNRVAEGNGAGEERSPSASHTVVSDGVEIGAFAVIGAGSAVTTSVPAFALMSVSPARPVGTVCRCGRPTSRREAGWGKGREVDVVQCPACGMRYEIRGNVVREFNPPEANHSLRHPDGVTPA